MKRKVIITQDGSSSITMEDWGESYHSVHGAVQEAKHVYLDNGLAHFKDACSIDILEMGLGTGLNAFLTYLQAKKWNLKVNYSAIEGFPISLQERALLNYEQFSDQKQDKSVFDLLHSSPWNATTLLSEAFTLTKWHNTFEQQQIGTQKYDLIYFDVFGYPYQPELWSQQIFDKMYQGLKPNGILTTYACRGVIKRTMQTAGFKVTKVPGPPGKREMIVAFK